MITANQAKMYEKYSVKYRIVCYNINFYQQCVNLKFSNYFNTKFNKIVTFSSSLYKSKMAWLKENLKNSYNYRNNIKLKVKILHIELVHNLHPIEWNLFDDKIRNIVAMESCKKTG